MDYKKKFCGSNEKKKKSLISTNEVQKQLPDKGRILSELKSRALASRKEQHAQRILQGTI